MRRICAQDTAAASACTSQAADVVQILRLDAGYWRISKATTDVRPCPVNGSTPRCRGDLV